MVPLYWIYSCTAAPVLGVLVFCKLKVVAVVVVVTR
jgi:hypothetical protein